MIGIELATEIVAAFLMARFTGEERHLRRLDKVMALEHGWAGEEELGEEPADSDDDAD